jgi:HAD superfamily hydrolase (TIGR01549 family)
VFDLFKTLGEFEWAITYETPRPCSEAENTICTGYEAGYEKSNPQIYKVITDGLQVEPEETVVIGDDPVLDIHNAKQHGMRRYTYLEERSPPGSRTA